MQTSEHIRDPTQASKAVDLARDLHYILINICQGAAATVVRQNRYNANGRETPRLLHNRFSLPVGTRSVGYLTKLLEPTFNEAQFEEKSLQWEYDINHYEKDNRLQYHSTKLKEHRNNISNYELDRSRTEIPGLPQDDLCFLKSYFGGPAPMDVDNIWRKGRNYKGKGKVQRQRALQGI